MVQQIRDLRKCIEIHIMYTQAHTRTHTHTDTHAHTPGPDARAFTHTQTHTHSSFYTLINTVIKGSEGELLFLLQPINP